MGFFSKLKWFSPMKQSAVIRIDTPKCIGGYDFNAVIDAIIMQESGGDASATSAVGAQGLMQLMPKTGQELADACGLAYAPFDAEQNRLLGTLYFTQLLKQFSGDLELALTAYHSGPGRVRKLLDQAEKEGKARNFRSIHPRLGPVGQKYARQVINRIKKA